MNNQTLQSNTHNILGIGLTLSLAYYGFMADGQLQEAAKISLAKSSENVSAQAQREIASIASTRIVDDAENDMNQEDVEKYLALNLRGSAKSQSKDLAKHLMELSKKHKFSPSFILSVIQAESSFRTNAKSYVGAMGLMQVRPGTAKYIAQKRDIASYKKSSDLRDPFVNLTIGVAYLSYLRNKFSNSIHYVAAYNLGPTTVNQMLKQNRFALGKVEKYVKEIHLGARTLKTKHSKRNKLLLAAF